MGRNKITILRVHQINNLVEDSFKDFGVAKNVGICPFCEATLDFSLLGVDFVREIWCEGKERQHTVSYIVGC
jgi:hypothetical protein